ncbi:unnamed protein product [Adineta ricciae]|uniref:Uncharacterized protein n=1 Tax=Adineta ricciae TaxID=249248 RepID=A0A814CXB5_ADIRI|nr:unnamed protein product [Adineta ricciae]CAF0946345.1 unnamed protein product [Adineta ricciae]
MSAKEAEEKTKVTTTEKDDDIPKLQSTTMVKTNDENKDEKKKEGEHTIEEIDQELNKLRPKSPSPNTKRRINEEEKEKDREVQEHKKHETTPAVTEIQKSETKDVSHRGDNELIPNQPDPTINDDVKIPVLNERGDVELKPQQGSALNKHENPTAPPSNNTQSSTDNKEPKQ